MKIDWKGLAQGVFNSIMGRKWIKELATYRYETFCKDCPYNSKNKPATARPDEHCTLCGCNMQFKIHNLSSSCPIDKWKAEMTEKEWEELNDKLKEDGKETEPLQ